ncbi:MAG: hypothetical protein OXF75_14405 [Acidimicrobiaceae bacterium]|nr:hypothetical protein [Acidimicrobiaceae bacterium]
MSKFTVAIRKYSTEIRKSKKEAPLEGLWARSYREFAVFWLVMTVGLATIVIPVSVFRYSVVMQIAVPVAVTLVTAVPWFAWIVWGRDAYPLKRE